MLEPDRSAPAPPDPSPAPRADLLRRWFTADARSLAAMRVATALVLLYDVANRAGDLADHYTDAGVMPRHVLLGEGTTWTDALSLNVLSGSYALQALLLAMMAVSAVMLLAGLATRVATVAAFVLVVSFHVRNPLVVYGADFVLKMILFWGIFLPWGARFSIDRWLARRRGLPRPPSDVYSTGVAAAMLQVGIVYLFTAYLKTGEEWRSEFTAIYWSLSLEDYIGGVGPILYRYPTIMKGLTIASLAVEAAVPFLLFSPVFTKQARLIALGLLTALHLGIMTTMKVGFFPFVNFASLLVFLPREAWTWLGEPAEPASVSAQPLRSGRLAELAAIAPVMLIGYVFAWNLGMPTVLHAPARILKIHQSWGMFAPRPFRDDGWWVLTGTLSDGRQVDLMRGGAPIDWKQRHGLIEGERWRKWYRYVHEKNGTEQTSDFAAYLCRRWRGALPGEAKLVRVDPSYIVEYNLPDYRKAPLQRHALPGADCAADERGP